VLDALRHSNWNEPRRERDRHGEAQLPRLMRKHRIRAEGNSLYTLSHGIRACYRPGRSQALWRLKMRPT
jgi:hypothetical protein